MLNAVKANGEITKKKERRKILLEQINEVCIEKKATEDHRSSGKSKENVRVERGIFLESKQAEDIGELNSIHAS